MADRVLITGEGNGQEIVLGCWPLRGDFQHEYVNKAEMPLMYMHIGPGEAREPLRLKL